MVCWNLRQAHFQEVGLMQIPTHYVSFYTKWVFPFLVVWPLDESQGPSQVRGHNPWTRV